MGPLSDLIQVVTVWLALLMAWPWNVALATLDGGPGVDTTGGQRSVVATTRHVHRVGRFNRWAQSGCPAIAQDYDEEGEEGSGGFLHLASAALLTPATFEPPAPAPAATAQLPSHAPAPRSRLCRLRC